MALVGWLVVRCKMILFPSAFFLCEKLSTDECRLAVLLDTTRTSDIKERDITLQQTESSYVKKEVAPVSVWALQSKC